MRVKQLLVLPKLPDRIKNLQGLAKNLWYSWNWDLVKLFIRLDPDMWERTYQNPVEMLTRLPQHVLQRAAEDEAFVVTLDRVHDKFKSYIELSKWFDHKYADFKDRKIAYFSLEYGLDTGLPVYSGGLGVLSGDTLKTASDLGLPMVATGLLYRYGYFRQTLSRDGWQQERYEENDWYHMPVELVKDENDVPLRVSMMLEDVPVQIGLWKTMVGQIPLYLLDTNLPENSSKAREITSVLYGGDKNMRIRQEIVLGIGGVKALRALGIAPAIYHSNEGHSWFLTLERLRQLIKEEGLSFKEAREFIWSTTVFTTHTPVPAGNEQFEPVLVHRYLGKLISDLGISWKDFLSIGRVNPDDEREPFGMTVAALRSSAFCNGVSELHGHVSRDMWHNIWPNLPLEEVPIRSITNGVHSQSWISHDMRDLYDSYFGPQFTERPGAPETWDKVYTIPDVELWRVHNRRRERLVFFARKRLRQQLIRRGASQLEIQTADDMLNPSTLTIGFARRFSTYKRGNLLLQDLDRLDSILNNPDRPVQIVLAGKAHPLDTPGKEIIKQIVSIASEDRFRHRIVFLEDYDINVGRYLVQGSDVWLNNPRRPQEASGTSGMKASLNGVVNLSVLDGWWDEAFNDEVGFKIGNGEEYDSVETQDRMDAEALYTALEREVIPLFYDRDQTDIPSKWVAKMKSAIHMSGQRFSAHRMLIDYTQHFYIPAIKANAHLSADNFAMCRRVTEWEGRIADSWEQIGIDDIEMPELGPNVYVGQRIPIRMFVRLGALTPDDVRVEIVSGRINSQDELQDYIPINATLDNGVAGNGDDGVFAYTGEVECLESGRFGITARVIPQNENLVHMKKPKLISWW
jgi:starch phosphorylase